MHFVIGRTLWVLLFLSFSNHILNESLKKIEQPSSLTYIRVGAPTGHGNKSLKTNFLFFELAMDL